MKKLESRQNEHIVNTAQNYLNYILQICCTAQMHERVKEHSIDKELPQTELFERYVWLYQEAIAAEDPTQLFAKSSNVLNLWAMELEKCKVALIRVGREERISGDYNLKGMLKMIDALQVAIEAYQAQFPNQDYVRLDKIESNHSPIDAQELQNCALIFLIYMIMCVIGSAVSAYLIFTSLKF